MDSRRPIRLMEADLIAQIKAGEVIERPASVVKELVENSIDAGARKIRVELQDGGAALIRVIDDGAGISPESLPLAFAEHTSSKLHRPEEMEQIQTLGFRGEALYAISNVARVEAISGIKGAETAQLVGFEFGEMVTNEPAAPAGGTRMAVHDIFSRIPARRKHLRSSRSETAATHQIVSQYAIAHPQIAISLYSDQRPLFASPGSGHMADSFGSVYGLNLIDSMIPFDHDGSVRVRGLVSPPTITRPNRSAISIFVNGRPVRSAALMFAIEDAMAGLLMVGRHPLAAVSIEIPPDYVDPNVHPTKQEVRFLAERPVFAAVRSAVMEAVNTRTVVAPARDPFESSQQDADQISLPTLPQAPRSPYPPDVNFAPTETQTAPASQPEAKTFGQLLPHLRVFGQAAQTFIIAEGPNGLYMIDQHAAHERVLFDALVERNGPTESQPLLDPMTVELLPHHLEVLENHQAEIGRIGFDVEPFGDNTFRIRSVPIVGRNPVDPAVVVDVIEAVGGARSATDVLNDALTVMACKAAVKAGDRLTMEEMRSLVESLEATPNPRSCPHGRPTTIHISTERLEREFGRR